ncbi:unnamed protein product, partial [Prunus brigantina]
VKFRLDWATNFCSTGAYIHAQVILNILFIQGPINNFFICLITQLIMLTSVCLRDGVFLSHPGFRVLWEKKTTCPVYEEI